MSKAKTYAFWIMVIVVIGLSIYLITYIHSNSYQCMNNPYTYGINLLERANNAPVVATYAVLKDRGAIVKLTRDGFSKLETDQEEREPLNLSINLKTED